MMLTPLEAGLIDRAARALRATALREMRVFGSRARGRARSDSDFDVAALLAGPFDAAVARMVAALEAELRSQAPVQIVPLFDAEPPSLLRAAVAREGITVWTRT
jgi:predicted nucleotidyltransferase